MTTTSKGRNWWVHRTCSVCGAQPEDPQDLLVRIVMWKVAGRHGRHVRSRTELYQCRSCAEKDLVWNQEKFTDSPGLEKIQDA